MATKAHKEKIGKIRLTDKQKEIIAVGIESEFFKVIESIIPKQLTKIAVASLNLAQNDKDLFYYKGRAKQATELIDYLRSVAEEYNRTNGDADTDGIDPLED